MGGSPPVLSPLPVPLPGPENGKTLLPLLVIGITFTSSFLVAPDPSFNPMSIEKYHMATVETRDEVVAQLERTAANMNWRREQVSRPIRAVGMQHEVFRCLAHRAFQAWAALGQIVGEILSGDGEMIARHVHMAS